MLGYFKEKKDRIVRPHGFKKMVECKMSAWLHNFLKSEAISEINQFKGRTLSVSKDIKYGYNI